jgi:hypothetical protein
MGMFDYVNASLPCPHCGAVNLGWQTKSGPCDFLKLDPDEVDNFYTSCRSCKAWIEYLRNEKPPPKEPRPTPFNAEEVAALGFKVV